MCIPQHVFVILNSYCTRKQSWLIEFDLKRKRMSIQGSIFFVTTLKHTLNNLEIEYSISLMRLSHIHVSQQCLLTSLKSSLIRRQFHLQMLEHVHYHPDADIARCRINHQIHLEENAFTSNFDYWCQLPKVHDATWTSGCWVISFRIILYNCCAV